MVLASQPWSARVLCPPPSWWTPAWHASRRSTRSSMPSSTRCSSRLGVPRLRFDSRWAVSRRAVPPQGPGLHRGWGTVPLRQPVPAGLRRTEGQRSRAALPGGRTNPGRQDQYARVRVDALHRTRPVRPDPQPLGAGPHSGRVQRWLGGRRGCGHGTHGQRGRWRWVDPDPSRLLWTVRPEGDEGPRADRPRHRPDLAGRGSRGSGLAQRAR